ncbi:CAMK family protein kinase [Trichomonas vaginalis G3]|uniref:CAMK family protein kinase n=1 Tax=Trichomonas vaginalis (strain ATCC PRA-98 / G3) TaxID=412133 RepID=A2EFB7_TRIV3|nr:protein serine/threonine kinase protein [Trichomonas vaginalis G3]EAY08614.1 CAMK family protein kinase [Trichomonas vaginalis G3]KAI5536728.1 protein serine/threonine kinase protein [Trichomonas vaginalis G3]|eukprot:XP_001320837.1 CAMK family protein kinase [Trichomonas vaginalis G3]
MSEDPKIPSSIGPYTFKQTLGHGAFSVVKLAIHNVTKQQFACKIIKKTALSKDNKAEERFELETRILQQMRHPNIAQLFDIMADGTFFYVVLEICPNGELFKFIIQNKFLPENEAKMYMKPIVEALKYIHDLKVVHRDLKPENILLDDKNRPKITDFGFSRYVLHDQLLKTTCGSPCYASPACIAGKEYDGFKNDIWGLGVIFFATVTGQLPWTKKIESELFEQISRAEYTIPSYISDDLRELISSMMNIDESKRPTCDQILASPWFANADETLPPPLQPQVVSLKALDIFFNRELSKLNVEFRVRKCTSKTYTEAELNSILNRQEAKNMPPINESNRKGRLPPRAIDMLVHKGHRYSTSPNASPTTPPLAPKQKIIKPKTMYHSQAPKLRTILRH